MIKIKNLTKIYGSNIRGVFDLSLEVKEGEIFGFIGPNGAGKSTTVRTLLNLIFPTRGSAQIKGMDCVKDSNKIKRMVGYIPSEIHFYGEMSVKKFLDYSFGFHQKIDHDYIKDLIKTLDLDTSKKIGSLSLGNKKKLAIIQALGHRPKLLILDEPTSGLDPLMQHTFFEILIQEKKRGTTIFFSSHILSEVQKVCDRVGIIKDGRLVRIESVKNIISNQSKKIKIKTRKEITKTEEMLDFKMINNQYTFLYKDDLNHLIKLLSSYDIEDLIIEEPSLEEIFMDYYESKEKA